MLKENRHLIIEKKQENLHFENKILFLLELESGLRIQIIRFLKKHFITFFYKTLRLKSVAKTLTDMVNFYIFLYFTKIPNGKSLEELIWSHSPNNDNTY